jgi:chromosome segregation ATPase
MSRFSPIDRDYPNTDNLIPKSPIPSACYRMALGFRPQLVMSLLKAAQMCVKGAAVELATLEGGKAKPMYGMTSNEDVRVTFLVMSCKVEHSALGKAVAQNSDMDRLSALERENERLRVQLKTAEEQCREESGRGGETGADESLKLQERLADMEKLLDSMRAESEGLRRKAEEWKRKAEKAANASAKATASDAAEATSLEEIAKWCESHTGTKARRKGNGPVWVTGNTKPCKDELAGMGFKYGFHKEFGKGWWKK